MLTTAMQEAFSRVGIYPNTLRNYRSKPRPMWNANLSFRTYNQLKKQGVMQ